jgi:hypothetical protein
MKCARCMARERPQPRDAVTIWWGDALCAECFQIRKRNREARQ